MKNLLLIIFVVFGTFVSTAQKGYKASKQTPEKNTKLSSMSWLIVQKVNKAVETGNVDSVFDIYKNKIPNCIIKPGCFFDAKVGNDSLPIRVFYPSKKAYKHRSTILLPVVVYYHGGGFIWGSLDMFHNLANKLSKILNCIVVLPDYRLAPEYPFPTPLNDCFYTLQWVHNHIDSLGGDGGRVGLMGDSAGANLALVCSLLNQQQPVPYNICFNVLYYPTTSMLEENFDSRKYFSGDSGDWYVLNRPLLEHIKEVYLQDFPDTLWQVSPLYASYSSGTPPTLIVTAECDPLRDEGEKLALKMKQSGVDVELIRFNRTIHGFVSFYPILRQGKQALKKTRKFVNKILEPNL